KSFERFGIARSDVFGSSVIVQKCVLRPDRGIIEPGRNRMRRCNLPVRVLKHVRHRALQNADLAAAALGTGVKSGGMVAHRIAPSSGFHTNESDSFVCDERMK